MPSDLTRTRHAQTRTDIADAAIALFSDRGFEATTMDDVADAAGVSRRTAYRHFASKDELVFEEPRRWIEQFVATTSDRRDGESTRDLLGRALVTVAELLEAERERVLAAYSVLIATPSLRGRHGKSDSDWRELCVQLLAPDVVERPEDLLPAVVAASALIGATNGLIAVWALGAGREDLVAMMHDVLDQIDSIWPASARELAR